MPKVLLVDDEQDMLELLTYHLENSGFSVSTATNGMEGLNAARSLLPDAIVLDLLLPDLDGMTVCELLRAQLSTARIPIVILTALAGQVSRIAGLEAGADGYFVKPVPPRLLADRLFALMNRKRAESGEAVFEG